MVIGRTDEQQNPLIPMALTCRAVVWMSLAEPIWASGHATALTGRTHDRIRTKTKSRKNHLNPTGRPHMVSDEVPPARIFEVERHPIQTERDDARLRMEYPDLRDRQCAASGC